jgi:hypothetical protein
MRNDDDFTATTKLDRPPGAFLDVYGEARPFEKAAQLSRSLKAAMSSLHYISDRPAIGLRCLLLPIALRAPSASRDEQRLQGHFGNCRIMQ